MARVILVVDGDSTSLARHCAVLKKPDYEVSAASTFDQAKDQLARLLPDLLVADVQLGAYNGLHLVIRARADYGSMSAIVTHALLDTVLEEEASRLGARYLVKPIEPAALQQAAGDALAGRGPRPWTGVRRWRRKHLEAALGARIVAGPARIHDISYGGLGFEIPSLTDDLPSVFEVTVPKFGLSLRAETVWRIRDTSGAVWGGAALTHGREDREPVWRAVVDQMS